MGKKYFIRSEGARFIWDLLMSLATVSVIVAVKWMIVEKAGTNDISNFVGIVDQYGNSLLQNYLTELDAKQLEKRLDCEYIWAV